MLQGRTRVFLAWLWIVMGLLCLGMGLVGLDALVAGVPLAAFCFVTSWRYYRSQVVLDGDAVTIRYAKPGRRTIQRDAVTRLDEIAGGLATRPVLVLNDGKRLVLEPASEMAGLRIFRVRRALSQWLGGA